MVDDVMVDGVDTDFEANDKPRAGQVLIGQDGSNLSSQTNSRSHLRRLTH